MEYYNKLKAEKEGGEIRMRVKIAKLSERVREVELPGDSSTIERVLQQANVQVRTGDVLMEDGQEATLQTTVRDGAIISLVPKVQGG